MRKQFPGFFPPTDAERKELWKTALFSFDTSTLLTLYRVKPGTVDKFLAILRQLKGQIWLTHQVAFEYLKNRPIVIEEAFVSYETTEAALRKLTEHVAADAKQISRHRFIDVVPIADEFVAAMEKVIVELPAQKRAHEKMLRKDKTMERIARLFAGQVGQPYQPNDLKTLIAEADKRYDERVPPGYADDKKEGHNKYGDFIIWKQLIAKAQEDQCPIILTIDDQKEDWWQKPKGKKKGPRPELVEEFFREVGQPFYMHTLDRFLQTAEAVLEIDVGEDAIDDARDIRESPLVLSPGQAKIERALQRAFEPVARSTNALRDIGGQQIDIQRNLLRALQPHIDAGDAFNNYLAVLGELHRSGPVDPVPADPESAENEHTESDRDSEAD